MKRLFIFFSILVSLLLLSFSFSSEPTYNLKCIIDVLEFYKKHKQLDCFYEYKPPYKSQKHKLCTSVKIKKCNNKIPLGYYKYSKKVFKIAQFVLNKPLSKKEKQIISALITCESNQNPKAIAIDNGYGLFQLTNVRNGDTIDVKQNAKLGLKLLYSKYKYAQKLLKKHFKKEYNQFDYKIKQHYTLRLYNGGSKQIKRLQRKTKVKEKYEDQNEYFYSLELCWYKASKINGRFRCFEKLNLYYPLKIFKTTDIYKRTY